MSLEGNLRELGLHEVCQLLALSRKSGTLHLRAQLEGRVASIVFHRGAIVDATSSAHVRPPTRAGDSRAIEALVLEFLTWRDGAFAFAPSPDDAAAPATGVRMATESILMEGARRAEGWARLADRIPHPRVVPTFVDVEPRQLPLLHLVPQEWEILTRVDGHRDLQTLGQALGRDTLDVAEIVHGLIGTGLLTLRDSAPSARAHPTPPSGRIAEAPPASPADLWVPGAVHNALTTADTSDDEEDSIFDPVRLGVQSPDGLPRLRTPLGARIVLDAGVAKQPADESFTRGEVSTPTPGAVPANARFLGDEAARRGDLAGALTLWSAYLRADEHGADADQVREAIALAARLHALLHPAARD